MAADGGRAHMAALSQHAAVTVRPGGRPLFGDADDITGCISGAALCGEGRSKEE